MRKTENELRKLQVAGFYADIDLGEPNNSLDELEKKIAEKMGFRASGVWVTSRRRPVQNSTA